LLLAFAALAAVPACAPPDRRAATSGVATVDDFGDTVRAGARSQRIVSLNPATTELLFAIGAGARLVGRTHWDTYPDSARLVPDLGDGMRPNIEAVIAARPDLVLLYASAENRAARDAFRHAGIQTLTQRIDLTEDFARGIVVLGRVVGDTARAIIVRDSVLASLARARSMTTGLKRPRVFWLLWESPMLAVGRGSFLNELIETAGADNIFADLAAPSPQVTFEEIVRRDPDVLLVGPSRVAALPGDPRWRPLRVVREGGVVTYDTLIVARPGVRLGEAAMYLARLFHPELRAQK
jgi:ABC-type Fe3+-hydroxamate transport system substrate-binding protein